MSLIPSLNLSTMLNSVDELCDNSQASRDFRQSLENKGGSFEDYALWIVEALGMKGNRQARMALQDVVNALGKKIGFRVEYGSYKKNDVRGITFDGFWQCKSGNVFLVYNFSEQHPKISIDEIAVILSRLNTKKQREAGVIIYALLFVGNLSIDFFLNSIPKDKLFGQGSILTYEDFFKLIDIKESNGLDFSFLERMLLPMNPLRLDEKIPWVKFLLEKLAKSALSAIPSKSPAIQSQAAALPPQPATPLSGPGQTVNSRIGPHDGVRKITLKPPGAQFPEGIDRFEQGLFDEALNIFIKITRAEPDNCDAQFWAGKTLFATERFAEALPYLRQAATLKPGTSAATLLLGQALFRLGSFEQACTEFQHALTIDPDNVELHMGLGLALLEQGDAQRALIELETAQGLAPSRPEIFAAQGRLYRKIGDHHKAIDAFISALSLDSENAEYYFQLGLIYDELDKSLESIEAYQNAVQLDPRQWRFHNNLGAAFFRSNKWNEAIEAYQRALALNPNYAEAHSNLGDAFRSTGEKNKAISCYQRALELKPHLLDTRLVLAELLVEMSRRDEAAAIYEKLRESRPSDMTVLRPLIKLYIDSGRQADAQRLCDDILAISPHETDVVILKGAALFEAGDVAGATTLFESILPNNQENPVLLFHLGNCYMSMHRIREAIDYLEEALKFDPTLIEANINLARAYAQDGKKALAILNFTKVLNLDPQNEAARQGLRQLG